MRAWLIPILSLICGGCANVAFLPFFSVPDAMAVRWVAHPSPDAPPCALYGFSSANEARRSAESTFAQSPAAMEKVAQHFDAYDRSLAQTIVAWPDFVAKCRGSARMFEVVYFEKVTYVIRDKFREVASLAIPVGQPLYCGPSSTYQPPWPVDSTIKKAQPTVK
jgi:hypothetical protein